MPETSSGSCLLFQSVNILAAGLLLLGVITSAYTSLVPARLRSKFWLTILLLLIALALFSKDVAEVMGQLGTVFVAMLAIWNDKLIDFFNPPACELLGPTRDPTIHKPQLKLSGGNQDSEYHQFHLEIKNLNPSRPLKSVRVSFRRYEVDGEKRCVAVARQFTWAPHESEPREGFVPRCKTLDFCYCNLTGKNLSLIIYSGSGHYEGGDRQFNHMEGSVVVLHLEITADNVANPIGQRLTIDMREAETKFSIEPEPIC